MHRPGSEDPHWRQRKFCYRGGACRYLHQQLEEVEIVPVQSKILAKKSVDEKVEPEAKKPVDQKVRRVNKLVKLKVNGKELTASSLDEIDSDSAISYGMLYAISV